MLAIYELSRTYRTRAGTEPVRALKSVSLDVNTGEIFSLLGPSGCGKTTMLQCIAGLETPDGGAISIGGQTVFSSKDRIVTPANERGLGMVFQSYAIWPHMTVAENVAFPLQQRGQHFSRTEIDKKVAEALDLVKLSAFAKRPAPQLSGGQQQRVALARAIVHKPRLLLLDEPLSNLDAKLRDTMRIELRQLIKSLGITALFVTHDQVEAMSMSDRVALMCEGNIVQVGQPREIYLHPETAFAADFIGSGNLINCAVISKQGNYVQVATPFGTVSSRAALGINVGDMAVLVIRPNAVIAHQGKPPQDASAGALIPGYVQMASFLGKEVEIEINVAGNERIIIATTPYHTIEPGEQIHLELPIERCIVVHPHLPTGGIRV